MGRGRAATKEEQISMNALNETGCNMTAIAKRLKRYRTCVTNVLRPK